MEIRRAFHLALVLLTVSCLEAAVAAPTPAPAQVDPNSDLARLYPKAGGIGLAVAIVPDPHVPRYRRLFDLEIQAITLGMLNDGYVLDRYAFPWSNTLSEDEDAKSKPKSPGAGSDEGAFGLMIFRCDGWREHACQDPTTIAADASTKSEYTRVRAIYLVTDTATWGVSPSLLTCATQRIREQLAGTKRTACPTKAAIEEKSEPPLGTAKVELLMYTERCQSNASRKTLVVLGPNFSGAMDSIGEQVANLVSPEITDFCLVSSTTTESSNPLAEKAYDHLSYVRLAVDDGIKLVYLSLLAEAFGYFNLDEQPEPAQGVRPPNRDRDVVFLAEASTFGYGVCNPWTQMEVGNRDRIKKFCRDAEILYFPAALADIRYGIEQQRERVQTSVQTAVKVALPSEHLTLDVGAENGSEFPENRQSKLTAASQQLALDHVLEQLELIGPKMVIVVATDVRDRLFLFDQLRNRLPSAMLIDLETDILLAHPDFLHASRGAVTVASANLFVRRGKLFGCESRKGRIRVPLASWALDGQGILADAVSRLYDSDQTPTELPCILNSASEAKFGPRAPVLHVVTLKGLRRISRVVELNPKSGSWAEQMAHTREARRGYVTVGRLLALLCCFVVVLPWLWIRPLRSYGQPTLIFAPRTITLVAAVAGATVWVFAMRAAYAGAEAVSGDALVYWSVTILLLALGGLYQCLRRVQESRQAVNELRKKFRRSIAAVGLFACALAAAPLVTSYQLPDSLSAVADDELLIGLALDIGQGLAYDVVIAVGVLTVLAIMIALATGLCIMERNNKLLAITAECREGEPRARTPRFPTAAIVGVVFIISLIAVPSLVPMLGGPRLTIFGPNASLVATLVLVVTTLGASIATAVAIHSSRRVRTISAVIGRCVAPPSGPGRTEAPGEYPGLWPANEWQPDLFAATPVVARVSPEIITNLNLDEKHPWKTLISEFLGKCDGCQRNDDGPHRRAVFALLASEVSLYRWFVAGSVLCAIASVCVAYLFPLEADYLLMWNLLVLVVHALLAGYVATAFERDGVLSNILCNRPKKATFSASLFTYAALPFFALGFAIAVAQVPGVVDWGGGLLALLGAIGIHM